MKGYSKTFSSRFGSVSVLWRPVNGSAKVFRVCLDSVDRAIAGAVLSSLEEKSCEAIDGLIKDMRLFFSGETIRFDLSLIDFAACSGFKKKVLLVEYDIPRGYVSTYKLLFYRRIY
jgi:O6-methylguanine-DNA--protein-cysteine methyltransferase